jgi:hypothetical protein
MSAGKALTIFSFGYWGWGNAARELVKALDAVEAKRGFEVALFVDTRISRSVRAKGFDGSAFEELVGQDRYVWMKGLGNEAIQRRAGPAIQISNPRDAEALLALALENRKRRLIFFCSCEWPIYPDSRCHRTEVASLVIKAARSRGIAAEVVEWPGGRPRVIDVHPSPKTLRVSKKAMTIPLGPRIPDPDFLGLPWGSIAKVNSSQSSHRHFVGPARFRGGRWVLPKLTDEMGRELLPADSLDRGTGWRRRWGFDPRTT